MAHHGAAVAHDDVAVGDDMAQRCIRQDAAALHDDAVAHFRALFHNHVAEQDGVLDMALDMAAVRDQAVLNDRLVAVVGGRLVLDAGQDRAVAEEYLVAHILVQQVHVGAEIIEGILDLDRIFIEQVARNRAVDQRAGQELALEVDAVVGDAVAQHMDQVLAAHDVNAQRNMLALALVRVADADVDRFLLAVEFNISGERRVLGLFGADHGQVRARLDMAVDHVVERDVCDDVAVRDHNVFGLVLLQEVDRARERVDLAAVFAGDERGSLFGVGIRRQQGDARVLTGKVPVLRVADVVDQRLVFVLHQHAHAVDTGVYHVGEHEVNDAVTAAPLDCADRAVLGDLAKIVVIIECNDDA